MHVCCLLQSSRTTPEMEAESVHMENMQELLQPVQGKSFLGDFRVQKDEATINMGRKLLMHGSENGGKTSKQFLIWHAFVCRVLQEETDMHICAYLKFRIHGNHLRGCWGRMHLNQGFESRKFKEGL